MFRHFYQLKIILILILFCFNIVKQKLKVEYEIEKFYCIENKIEIDDDDLLEALVSKIKLQSITVTIVALGADDEYGKHLTLTILSLINLILFYI